MKNINIFSLIEAECRKPTCSSYEYDSTPTAEERLKNILKLIEQYKNETN